MFETRQGLFPFLGVAVRRPNVIGAIAPSSASLATRLAAIVPDDGAPSVIELGAGSGVVSDAIAARLPHGGQHIAVEVDPTMVDLLHRTRPSLRVVHGDATELGALLTPHGVRSADVVVSGLPWSLFEPGEQEAILGEVVDLLADDGVFTTFVYSYATVLSSARRFRRLLRARFDEVLITRTVWRNLPPALTYVCRRPRIR